MLHYLTANTFFELTCFLIGLVFLIRDPKPVWRLFIVYLLLTCITEIAAIYLRRNARVSNFGIYNIFILVECGATTFFFYYLFDTYTPKAKWVFYWLIAFFIVYFVELNVNHYSSFVSFTASFMSIVFVLFSLYFYYLLLDSHRYVKLSRHAPFWWVNGTLLFYFGSTAANLFFDYLLHFKVAQFSQSVFYLIYNILNIILYSCWSYSFICRYYQRKLLFS